MAGKGTDPRNLPILYKNPHDLRPCASPVAALKFAGVLRLCSDRNKSVRAEQG